MPSPLQSIAHFSLPAGALERIGEVAQRLVAPPETASLTRIAAAKHRIARCAVALREVLAELVDIGESLRPVPDVDPLDINDLANLTRACRAPGSPVDVNGLYFFTDPEIQLASELELLCGGAPDAELPNLIARADKLAARDEGAQIECTLAGALADNWQSYLRPRGEGPCPV